MNPNQEITNQAYQIQMNLCREIFTKKIKDYGLSWAVMRLTTITDQLMIKINRIIQIEKSGINLIGDDVSSEYRAIINYSLIAQILHNNPNITLDTPIDQVIQYYDLEAKITFELMQRKNNDYGESWRDMRISSLSDLILTKLIRIKQIEDNQGKTIASEGVYGNYQDILNYACFALIRLHS
ncbi:MAG: DUF1599 domain-containing protein [Chitinophagales bacterium]|jgi:hypothetical protein|nr:DUF1599 domain-containing protein [Chitinophagales bacterium]